MKEVIVLAISVALVNASISFYLYRRMIDKLKYHDSDNTLAQDSIVDSMGELSDQIYSVRENMNEILDKTRINNDALICLRESFDSVYTELDRLSTKINRLTRGGRNSRLKINKMKEIL